MAYSVTLETLRESTLQRANLQGKANFIRQPELDGLINGSIAEWVDEVRGTTWNGTYNRSSQSITTVLNTATYALATDFLSLISVDITITAGSPVLTARPYQEEERNAFRSLPIMGGWGFAQPVFYQIQGSNIAFIPLPNAAYSVSVNYVPTAPVLVAGTESIDSINGWEEFIVLDAAIKLLIKVGGNDQIPVLADRLEKQRGRIRAMAPRRDQGTAERVHVIENAGFDGWDY